MCRWLAYLGSPIPLEDVLVTPNHSLIDQSLLARDLIVPGAGIGAQFRGHAFPTNGDGFGVAWSGRGGRIGRFRQVEPAWDSQNLRALAAQIASGCFLAHVRAAPGGTIAEQNCHPFVHDGWMFQHNGEINGFSALKRDLTFDVAPDLYPGILGNGDTEVCFFLALTYGLADDPVAALRRMVARVERARHERDIAEPFRATMCASDGSRLVVLRWISPDQDPAAPAQEAPSLFHSAGPVSLHTAEDAGSPLPDDAQLVASEPLELHWSRRTWHEVPTGTIGVFRPGAEPEFTPVTSDA
ncbi:class II glutamine amidotransferase [Leucobacter rhizosphaerae]|uniref:Class II glutamine amidotransferase n=1 Tax=Leucobacter rhizosphaerae TaxID=2932245 RepID=A0ABY4FU34_9MICO|nr:class II glutamine amidotransferase [Leucobacter rhizosphaerae]UOQ59772.1 class II glutamine amidotransferase [Leucobacter rhizosphaerae]